MAIVPFSTLELPDAHESAQVLEHLKAMSSACLVAFAIRNAGTTIENAVERYQGEFREAGFCIAPLTKIPLQGSRPNRLLPRKGDDRGLHIHNLPRPDLSSIVVANLHHEVDGDVEASFFEPRTVTFNNQTLEYFYRGVADSHFRKGLVDDAILTPVRHRISASKGDLIFSRFHGQKPPAHDYTTKSLIRSSNVMIAQKDF